MRTLLRGTALLLVSALLTGCEEMVPPPPNPAELPIHTDQRCPYPSKYRMMDQVAAGSLCITASAAVPRESLADVVRWTSTMLQHRPDLVERLRAAGAVGFVLGRDEHACDLTIWDPASGGSCPFTHIAFSVGPGFVCPAVTMPPSGPDGDWNGEGGNNVCVHEAAHTIELTALSTETGQRILDRAGTPDVQRLWRDTYAVLDGEFFAVMTSIYFYTDRVSAEHHDAPGRLINTPAKLREYDPETYRLIHAIYRGSADLRS